MSWKFKNGLYRSDRSIIATAGKGIVEGEVSVTPFVEEDFSGAHAVNTATWQANSWQKAGVTRQTIKTDTPYPGKARYLRYEWPTIQQCFDDSVGVTFIGNGTINPVTGTTPSASGKTEFWLEVASRFVGEWDFVADCKSRDLKFRRFYVSPESLKGPYFGHNIGTQAHCPIIWKTPGVSISGTLNYPERSPTDDPDAVGKFDCRTDGMFDAEWRVWREHGKLASGIGIRDGQYDVRTYLPNIDGSLDLSSEQRYFASGTGTRQVDIEGNVAGYMIGVRTEDLQAGDRFTSLNYFKEGLNLNTKPVTANPLYRDVGYIKIYFTDPGWGW